MMEKIRGFEIISSYENKDIHLPERKTAASAAYDLEAAEDTDIPVFSLGQKPILVKTGLKSYFPKDEVLILANRSSNPMKHGLVLANSIGVIDSDYYNNADNEGHLLIAFYNFSNETVHIQKGDRIAQAMFMPFLVADNDNASGIRTGGFGSTGKV